MRKKEDRIIKSIRRSPSGSTVIITYVQKCRDRWQMLSWVRGNVSYVAQDKREYKMLKSLAADQYVVRGVQPGISRVCWFITDAGRAALAEKEG